MLLSWNLRGRVVGHTRTSCSLSPIDIVFSHTLHRHLLGPGLGVVAYSDAGCRGSLLPRQDPLCSSRRHPQVRFRVTKMAGMSDADISQPGRRASVFGGMKFLGEMRQRVL